MIAAFSGKHRLDPRRSDRRGKAGSRCGFTLLELLIASALAATLLVGLWTMFSVYSSLFESGFTRVELSQAARALVQQLSDDLHHAIQDPLPGVPQRTAGETAVRRFGLLGSADRLRIDVLQPTAELPNLAPVSDTEGIVRERAGPRIPELRTVYYEFRDPAAERPEEPTSDSFAAAGEAEQGGRPRVPGLVRRELDFEVPPAESDNAGRTFVGRSDLASGGSEADQGRPPEWIDLSEYFAEGSDIWLPEVVGLSFRYFDGQSWSSSWNSLDRKSLPVAVEVTLQLVARDDLQAWLHSKQQGSVAVDSRAEGATPALPETASAGAAGESRATAPPVHALRCVIDVPGSPMHPAPRSASRVAVERSERRAVRQVLSRPMLVRPPERQQPAQLPDQWIRTNP